MTSAEILKLLKKNPNFKVIKFDTGITIDTGDRSYIISDPNISKSLPKHPNIEDVKEVQARNPDYLRELGKFGERVDNIPKQLFEGKKPIHDPYSTKRTIPQRDITQTSRISIEASEVVPTNINALINDFFTSYLASGSDKSPLAYYDEYAKKKKFDVKTLKQFSKTTIKKEIERLSKSKDLEKFKGYQKKLLRAKFKAYEYERDLQVKLDQAVLYSNGEYVVFTNQRMSDKSLNTLGTVMQDLFKVNDTIKVMDSTRVHTIIPKGEHIFIDGFVHNKQMLDLNQVVADTLRVDRTLSLANVSKADQAFIQKQNEIAPGAIRELQDLVKASTKGLNSSEMVVALNKRKVGELKNLAKRLGIETHYLQKWHYADDSSLSTVLPNDFKKNLINNAIQKDMTTWNKTINRKKASIFKRAKSLGIDPEALKKELSKFSIGEREARPEVFDRYSKTLDLIYRNLSETRVEALKDLKLKGNVSISEIKRLLNRNKVRKYRDADVAKLYEYLHKDVPEGGKLLEKNKYLRTNLTNPLVNLEGRLKQRATNKFISMLVNEAATTRPTRIRPFDPKRVEQLLSIFSDKGFNKLAKLVENPPSALGKKGGEAFTRAMYEKFGGEQEFTKLLGKFTGVPDVDYRAARPFEANPEAVFGEIGDERLDKIAKESLNTGKVTDTVPGNEVLASDINKYLDDLLSNPELSKKEKERALQQKILDELGRTRGYDVYEYQLGEKAIKVAKYLESGKPLNLSQLGEYIDLAKELGINVEHEDLKNVHKKVKEKIEKVLEVQFGGKVDLTRKAVGVGMNNYLFKQTATAPAAAFDALGISELGWAKDLGNGKVDYGQLVRYAENPANFPIFAGKGVMKKFHETMKTIGGPLHEGWYTKRERNAVDEFRRNDVMVSPAERAQVKYDLFEWYKNKPFVSKPVTSGFGRSVFKATKVFEQKFDPRTFSLVDDPQLTKAKKNRALAFMYKHPGFKKFQKAMVSKAMDKFKSEQLKQMLRSNTEVIIKAYAGEKLGIKGDQLAIHTRRTLEHIGNLFQFIEQQKKAGNWVVANSLEYGLEKTLKDTQKALSNKGYFSETNQKLIDKVLTNPTEVNKKVLSHAASKLGDYALEYAGAHGVEMPTYGIEYPKGGLVIEDLVASEAKKKLLGYGKGTGVPFRGITEYEYAHGIAMPKLFEELSTVKDPMNLLEKAEADAFKKDRKFADMQFYPKEPNAVKPLSMYQKLTRAAAAAKGKPWVSPVKLVSFKEPKDIITSRPSVPFTAEPMYGFNSIPVDYGTKTLFDINAVNFQKAVPDFVGHERLRKKYLDVLEKLPEEKKAEWLKRYLKRFKMLNRGGKIPGKGTKDEVPALLTKGETVVDRKTSEKLGIHSQADYERFKAAVHAGKINKFADGGWVEFANILRDANKPEDFAKAKELFDNLSGNDKTAAEQLLASNGMTYDSLKSQASVSSQRRTQSTPRQPKNRTSAAKMTINMARGSFRIDKNENPKFNINKIDTYLNSVQGADILANSGNEVSKRAVERAKRNISKEFLSNYGLNETMLAEISSGTPSKATKRAIKGLSLDQVTQIKNIGKQFEKLNPELHAFTQNIKTYNKQFNASKKSKTKMPTKFKLDRDLLASNAEMLGEAFGISPEEFKKFAGASKKKTFKQLKKIMENIDYANLKPETQTKSVEALQAQSDSLRAFKRLSEQSYKTGTMFKERQAVEAYASQIERAYSQRRQAQARIGEFGSLMMQNAAFMGSYVAIDAVSGLFTKTIGFMSEFSDATKNLQAITGDTTDGLNIMVKAIKKVSTETKFSAVEIADAATILGQAGFSAVDIQKSLGGVVKLATATGSKLEDATQILTSALTIWDKPLSESKKLANEFTAAINQSKLDIQSLTGAIQYTGNIAAAAKIPVEDVLTMTALLKDAGIKRASTLGTGQRLLYSDISAPSKKFVESLKDAGITLAEFTKTFDEQGILGALKLMKDAGYGMAQASKGMELREKATYLAAINQLEKAPMFRAGIVGTSAADIANTVQMEGLGNSFKNMLNSWQISMNDIVGGLEKPLVDLTKALTIAQKNRSQDQSIFTNNFTLEDKLRPDKSASPLILGGVTAAAMMAAVGIGPKRLGAIALESGKQLGKMIGESKFLPEGIKHGLTATLPGAIGTLERYSEKIGGKRVLSAVGKHAGGLAYGAASAYLAPEGSKMDATMSAFMQYAGYMGGTKFADRVAIKTLGWDPKAFKSRLLRGGAGIGAALLLDQLTSSGRNSEDGMSRGTAALTTGLTAAAMTPGGPFVRALAGLAVGGLSYLSTAEAPTIGVTKALQVLTNDAKALSAELNTLGKSATSISDLSNYALRYSPNASFAEKQSKVAATVEEFAAVGDNLKNLEKVLSSYGGGFAGFNFGSRFTTRDINAGIFTVQKFVADGATIKSVDFTGKFNTAAEAAAFSLRSAQTAAYNALSAPGGAYETKFNELKSKEFTKYKEKLEGAKTFEERAQVYQREVIQPLFDLFRNAPSVGMRNKQGFWSILMSAGMQLRSQTPEEERYRIDNMIDRYEKQFKAMTEVASLNAQTSAQVLEIAKQRIGQGQAAFDAYFKKNKQGEYLKSTRIDMEAYRQFKSKEVGLDHMLDKINEKALKLNKINTTAVNLTRTMSVQAAEAMKGSIVTLGPDLFNVAIQTATELMPVLDNLTKNIRTNISKLGDLQGVSAASYLRGHKNFTLIDEKAFEKYVTSKGKDLDNKELAKLQVTGENLVNISGYRASTTVGTQLLDIYKRNEARTNAIVDKVLRMASPAEAQDITQYRMRKGLDRTMQGLGFAGYNEFRIAQSQVNPMTASIEQIKSLAKPSMIRSMEMKKQFAIDQIHTNEIYAEKMAYKQADISKRELGISIDQKVAAMARQDNFNRMMAKRSFEFNKQQLLQTTAWKAEDLYQNYDYALEDISKNYSRAIDNINTGYERAVAKIQRSAEYSRESAQIHADRARRDAKIRYERQIEDIGIKAARQREAAQINYSRQVADIARQGAYQREAIIRRSAYQEQRARLNFARGLEDLNRAINRRIEDMKEGKDFQREDALLKYQRAVAKAQRSYQDTLNAIHRNYQRNIEAIERSRQDTINAFNRSLERPQVITLDPGKLDIIANAINDWSLALDAHKAALAANTTAIKQNSALQKAKENIVAEAYKDAYKKVGGKVYDENGNINADFTKAYQDYLNNNSEKLIDTVLENALNRAFAGIGFNIDQALNNPAYLANMVANPMPAMTTAGALTGSGLTGNQAAQALYGIKANEVRISTTTGVILEAQGGMEGALYDLETAMINFDIKIREAGINLNQALEDAAINLQITLRELAISYQQALEDINRVFAEQSDQLSKQRERGLEDLHLRLQRQLEDIAISRQQALSELSISLGQAFEQARISYQRALEDIARNEQQAMEDARRNYERSMEDINRGLKDAFDDITRNMNNAINEAGIGRTQAIEDATLRMKQNIEDAGESLRRNLQAVDDSYQRNLQVMTDQLNQLLDNMSLKFQFNYDELMIQMEEMKGKIDRNLQDTVDNIHEKSTEAINNLNTQFDNMWRQWIETARTKGQEAIDALRESFSAKTWDTAVMLQNLQSQLDNVWRNLKVDADAIVQQVAAGMKAAFSGAAMKQIEAQLGKDVSDLVRKGLKVTNVDTKELKKNIETALDNLFKKELAQSTKATAEALVEPVAMLTEQTTKAGQAMVQGSTQVTQGAQQLKQAGESLKGSGENLKRGAEDLKQAGPNLVQGGAYLKVAGETLIQAGDPLEAAGNSLIQTAPLVISGTQQMAVALSMLAGSIPPLINAVVIAAQQAKAQLNQASSGYSTGGLIPGYGGGDIVYAMLEPGEFVVRKEVVRAKGEDYFNRLNYGVENVQPVTIQTTSSPNIPGQGINVNIGVQANVGVDAIKENIEVIADGVRKVFEEYA